MKKIIILSITIFAAMSFAGQSAPADASAVDPNSGTAQGLVYWSGSGTGAWQKFEIYYDMESGTFEGKWWYDNTHYGKITGAATSEISGGVTGKGRFGGDYAGAWSGTFYFRGECFGKTWAKSDPPGDGEFWGI